MTKNLSICCGAEIVENHCMKCRQWTNPKPCSLAPMENSEKIILHLCASKFASDSEPYRSAGYDVRKITEKIDVRRYEPPDHVYGIIANPPCTQFSIAKTCGSPRDLEKGMELVIACLRIIWKCQYELKPGTREPFLKFWAIENPATGLLRRFLGKPSFVYSPNQFGANFTKKTALWGIFNPPIYPILGENLQVGRTVTDAFKTSDQRSCAAPEFTKAFFLANP